MATYDKEKNEVTLNEFELHDLTARLNSTGFLEEIGIVLEDAGGAPQFKLVAKDPRTSEYTRDLLESSINAAMTQLMLLDNILHLLAEYTC